MLKYKCYKERLDTLWAPAIKIWSNGIPLKLDIYQSCLNECNFCYSKELRDMTLLRNGIIQNPRVARLVNSRSIINFFNRAFREDDIVHPFMNWALRNKYFIELGTTGETFQECDKELRLTYNFLKLTSALHIPLFINTKLNLLCRDEEYKQLLIDYQAPIILEVSFTSTDNKLVKRFEPLSPLPSERLKVIRDLSQYPHIATFAYISPFIPGLTDIDIDKLMNDFLDANIVGAHLRDFFLQGKTFQKEFWKKYMEEYKDKIETFPGGYHVKYKERIDFLEKATQIATKRNPLFKIVGMKTRFFDMDSHYGKGVFDILPDNFKEGIVDFTIVPILRKIKENPDVPQLLFWNKLGYKKDKIRYPQYIRSNEGDINNLIDWGCNCNKSEVEMRIEGYTWIESGLWNGFEQYPSGFISKIEGIFPVKDKNNYSKENDDWIYVYIPEKYFHLVKSTNKQMRLDFVDIKQLKQPYISLNDTKEFLIPERNGGIEDKWLSKKQLLEERLN